MNWDAAFDSIVCDVGPLTALLCNTRASLCCNGLLMSRGALHVSSCRCALNETLASHCTAVVSEDSLQADRRFTTLLNKTQSSDVLLNRNKLETAK